MSDNRKKRRCERVYIIYRALAHRLKYMLHMVFSFFLSSFFSLTLRRCSPSAYAPPTAATAVGRTGVRGDCCSCGILLVGRTQAAGEHRRSAAAVRAVRFARSVGRRCECECIDRRHCICSSICASPIRRAAFESVVAVQRLSGTPHAVRRRGVHDGLSRSLRSSVSRSSRSRTGRT